MLQWLLRFRSNKLESTLCILNALSGTSNRRKCARAFHVYVILFPNCHLQPITVPMRSGVFGFILKF